MISSVGRYLYIVRYGDTTKVGITLDLPHRFGQYRCQARKDGVTFTPLFARPRHLNAQPNESATVRQFLLPGQKWTEYLTADPREVIDFVRTLPIEGQPRPHWEIDRSLAGVIRRTGIEVA